MKPCRWGYKMNQGGNQYNTTFPLAVKDMYMYENIPELIEAGVVSFKIEGRMREADYLLGIINSYSDAINRYIEDPIFMIVRRIQKRCMKTENVISRPLMLLVNQD